MFKSFDSEAFFESMTDAYNFTANAAAEATYHGYRTAQRLPNVAGHVVVDTVSSIGGMVADAATLVVYDSGVASAVVDGTVNNFLVYKSYITGYPGDIKYFSAAQEWGWTNGVLGDIQNGLTNNDWDWSNIAERRGAPDRWATVQFFQAADTWYSTTVEKAALAMPYRMVSQYDLAMATLVSSQYEAGSLDQDIYADRMNLILVDRLAYKPQNDMEQLVDESIRMVGNIAATWWCGGTVGFVNGARSTIKTGMFVSILALSGDVNSNRQLQTSDALPLPAQDASISGVQRDQLAVNALDIVIRGAFLSDDHQEIDPAYSLQINRNLHMALFADSDARTPDSPFTVSLPAKITDETVLAVSQILPLYPWTQFRVETNADGYTVFEQLFEVTQESYIAGSDPYAQAIETLASYRGSEGFEGRDPSVFNPQIWSVETALYTMGLVKDLPDGRATDGCLDRYNDVLRGARLSRVTALDIENPAELPAYQDAAGGLGSFTISPSSILRSPFYRILDREGLDAELTTLTAQGAVDVRTADLVRTAWGRAAASEADPRWLDRGEEARFRAEIDTLNLNATARTALGLE